MFSTPQCNCVLSGFAWLLPQLRFPTSAVKKMTTHIIFCLRMLIELCFESIAEKWYAKYKSRGGGLGWLSLLYSNSELHRDHPIPAFGGTPRSEAWNRALNVQMPWKNHDVIIHTMLLIRLRSLHLTTDFHRCQVPCLAPPTEKPALTLWMVSARMVLLDGFVLISIVGVLCHSTVNFHRRQDISTQAPWLVSPTENLALRLFVVSARMVLFDGLVLISIAGALLYPLLFAVRLNGDPRRIDTHIWKSHFCFHSQTNQRQRLERESLVFCDVDFQLLIAWPFEVETFHCFHHWYLWGCLAPCSSALTGVSSSSPSFSTTAVEKKCGNRRWKHSSLVRKVIEERLFRMDNDFFMLDLLAFSKCCFGMQFRSVCSGRTCSSFSSQNAWSLYTRIRAWIVLYAVLCEHRQTAKTSPSCALLKSLRAFEQSVQRICNDYCVLFNLG